MGINRCDLLDVMRHQNQRRRVLHLAKVVDDTELLVDLGKDNQVRVIRSTVSSVLSKPDPAEAKKSKPANDTDDNGNGEGKAKTGRKRGKAKK